MQTSDWAVGAHVWFTAYHEAIAEGKSILSFLEPLEVDDSLLTAFQNHPLLGQVNLENWQSTPFDLLEQSRGWQPFLRRLPHVPNNRLLTLIRRNLHLPLDQISNQTLVSRQQWALIEGLRWKSGLYNKAQILSTINQTHSLEQETQKIDDMTLQVQSDGTAGRYICWRGPKPAQPGEVIWKAKPFAVAPFELKGSACFFCGKPTKVNVVRDLGLLCVKCKVWSYCSEACKQENSPMHNQECEHITELVNKCEELDLPVFKGLLVYRAAIRSNQDGWKSMLELEVHDSDHRANNPTYVRQAEAIADWMAVQKKLVTLDAPTITALFFAININAIGLGPGATGFFPGIPSMFNHSCLENVTHGWDEDGYLRFRAVETIESGSECCISYVSNLESPTHERTADLQRYKFFSCMCDRCDSADEQGRLNAVVEWRECLENLQAEKGESIDTYRRLVELSEILFPQYFVTKGWAMEECAHALLQDARLKDESLRLLTSARLQYVICRGEDSYPVKRVDEAYMELQEQPKVDSEEIEQDEAMEGNDLSFRSGWSHSLLEVKTFEAEENFSRLSQQIWQAFENSNMVVWTRDFRLADVGFGIKTLVLACRFNESICGKEEFAEDIADRFDDIIQSVDIIHNHDYH